MYNNILKEDVMLIASSIRRYESNGVNGPGKEIKCLVKIPWHCLLFLTVISKFIVSSVILIHWLVKSISFVHQMADAGFHCFAPDWIGFGFTDKPQPGYGFDYTGS